MELSKASKIMNGTLQCPDVSFETVSRDTRTLKQNALYFALKGENFDGHDFIAEAKKAGAAAVVVSRPIQTNVPTIQVNDTIEALGKLATYHQQQINPRKVVVTGSCGKTTTRAFLEGVFSEQGNTLASEGSYNNSIGVPLTLLNLNSTHQYLIAEMGANHPGEIAYLTQLVEPNVAIITNAAPAHLEGFHSVEGVAHAKGEIFQGLDSSGTAVINADSEWSEFWKTLCGHCRVVTFGIEKKADVMALDITFSPFGQPSFSLILPNGKTDIHLSVMGQHNVSNALAAAAAGYASGVAIEKIKRGLEKTQAVNKRLVRKTAFNGALLIDDSYNANPLSVFAAMQVLIATQAKTKVLVLGDMRELGEKTLELHYHLGLDATRLGIHQLYCFGDSTRETARAFGESAQHFTTQDALIAQLKDELTTEMAVLVKGSNSMRMDKVVVALMEVH